MVLIGLSLVASLVGAFAATLLLRHYLPEYAKEKGKNLATKEDIGEITRKVEAIRAEYNHVLEEIKNRNQLRLAAIDRRLQAHQEAYAYWAALMKYIHEDRVDEVAREAEDWWTHNCLYLTPAARRAFSDAVWAAHNHRSYVRERIEVADIRANFAMVRSAVDAIVAGVELPSLGEAEQPLHPKQGK